jgi:hypothetical protein
MHLVTKRNLLNRFQPEAMRLQSAILVAGGGVSSARLCIMDKLIASLKRTGVWPKLDALYIFANSDSPSALINWKTPGTFGCTAVNSPTFAADRGFTGNGTSSYLDTNYIPSSNGINWQQDSASLFNWCLTAGVVGPGCGCAGNHAYIYNQDATNSYFLLNDGTQIAAGLPGANLLLVSRPAANSVVAYIGASSVGSNASASGARTNTNVRICAEQGLFGTGQMAVGGFGGGMSGTDVTNLYNALLAYLKAVGAA